VPTVASASRTRRSPAIDSAVVGSFSPEPVSTQTTTASPGSSPVAAARETPASPAADEGSQNTPSSSASARYAARISSSLTASIRPPLSSRAAIAFVHEAGFPIRIAVAIVSGCSIGRPRTSGAAPAAWKPHIAGVAEACPRAAYSRKPAQ
jgi:hypothetical protein